MSKVEYLKDARDNLINETNCLEEEFGNLINFLRELDYLCGHVKVKEHESKINTSSTDELAILVDALKEVIFRLKS